MNSMKKEPLTIKNVHDWYHIDHIITGWSDEDWKKIKSMNGKDAYDWILDEIDKRNNGMATCWHNGYGIDKVTYRDDEYVCVRTSMSSD